MVSTIAPLVKVAGRQWLASTAAFVGACAVAGAAGGLLLGSIGALLPTDGRTSSTALAVLAGVAAPLEVGALGRVPLLAGSVPQSWWVSLGPHRGALAYGGVLGLGITTAVPFVAFYVLMIAALLAGPLAGAFIGCAYGLARALPVPIASLAIWRGADNQKVSDWALGRRAIAKRACALGVVSVALIAAAGAI